ncbi:hypothetical protein V1520DRAFT_336139 [Lipomyces starkeyi]|uniref:Peptidase S54 rhomboid domain-containing protein n=1 Tax=Lipomyces starkeyi NRRL Y-11557 TaxID=675824 RepID=A0A1E3Q4M3_LIPST|nr:hypothetical protein LIPSTDRAFT_28131 [Lipomyces starkeyi NRRL Y-11557]
MGVWTPLGSVWRSHICTPSLVARISAKPASPMIPRSLVWSSSSQQLGPLTRSVHTRPSRNIKSLLADSRLWIWRRPTTSTPFFSAYTSVRTVQSSLTRNTRSTQFLQKRFYQHWYNRQTPFQRLLFTFKSLSFAQVCYGLIGTFVAIYVLKSLVPGFPRLYYYGSGSPWYTPITCMFDHANIGHLFSNSLFLFCLSTIFPYGITSTATIAIFLVGGLSGLLVSTMLARHNEQKALEKGYFARHGFERHRAVMGASAAIYALTAVQTFLDPFGRIALYGIIPMSNWMFLAGIVTFDLFGVLRNQALSSQGSVPVGGSFIDNAGHLGGFAAGVISYVLMRRFRFLRRGFDF